MGGGEFPILDAILVLVVLLELALGWLRGLLASVFGLVGLVAGAIAGAARSPWHPGIVYVGGSDYLINRSA